MSQMVFTIIFSFWVFQTSILQCRIFKINTLISLKDKLGLRSTEEREQILSKLYEIQHPSGPTVAEILREPFPKSKISQPRSSRESRSLSGREGHNDRSTHDDIIPRLHVWHDLSGKLKSKHSFFFFPLITSI